MRPTDDAPLTGWRRTGHEIIFESDTSLGKAFDVGLILAILVSIAVVMLESVRDIREHHGPLLRSAEWVLTVVFTLEYILRLLCVQRPRGYATSAFGIIDLLAILPSFASLLFPGAQALVVIRTFRILRVFRVLKLAHYVNESEVLVRALVASRRKIAVFVCAVFTLVIVFGSLMYVIEGPTHGFTSIPRGLYWAVVTMTTVGYGDISPKTNLGQAISALMMVVGYGIIAVPTGIVSAQLTRESNDVSGQACPSCGAGTHYLDALFCRLCGARL